MRLCTLSDLFCWLGSRLMCFFSVVAVWFGLHVSQSWIGAARVFAAVLGGAGECTSCGVG